MSTKEKTPSPQKQIKQPQFPCPIRSIQINDVMSPGTTYQTYSGRQWSQRLRLWLCKKLLEVLLPEPDSNMRLEIHINEGDE